MALSTWSPKDPDDILDYQLIWTDRLAPADTIATSVWLIDSGEITIDSDTFTDNTTTIWLSGGTAATNVILTNRITTAGGRQYDQSVSLNIVQK